MSDAHATGALLPMFPLGTVLFPHAALPLHVFEPRYREMVRTCLDGDARFGVVLIERGSEVGGGDVRSSLGTVAEIAEASELPDGRWALLGVGRERLRVVEWLPDDPYPRAMVEQLGAEAWSDALDGRVADVERLVRRALALASELGERVPPATTEIDPHPAVAAWQLAALAPLGPFDRQRVLGCEDAAVRLALLTELTAETVDLLARRLGGG